MNTRAPRRLASPRTAGRNLARHLARFAGCGNLIVLALPNGGVPVAAELASILKVPFDILMIQEITAPDRDREILGTITTGGVRVLDYAVIDRLQVSDEELNAAILTESLDLARRARFYRGGQPSLEIADCKVILVDDGSTPCAKLSNAVRLLRRQHAEQVIMAVPAACHHVARELRLEAVEVVSLAESPSPAVVGRWLKQFPRVTHHEVRRLVVAVQRDGNSGSGTSPRIALSHLRPPARPGSSATGRFRFSIPPRQH